MDTSKQGKQGDVDCGKVRIGEVHGPRAEANKNSTQSHAEEQTSGQSSKKKAPKIVPITCECKVQKGVASKGCQRVTVN